MNTTAISKRDVFDAVEKAKASFIARLPQDGNTERMFLGLMTVLQKKPDLQRCNPSSVILAAYEAAELGINLSPSLGLGYLVPYGGEAQFQIGYRGMIQKAYETGGIETFYAEVVYSKDKFSRQFAPVRTIHHEPSDEADRGEPIGAYALLKPKDGPLDFEFLTAEQIGRHKKASKNQGGLLWTTFWEEGWRKTPIRVLFKRVSLQNPGMEKLAEAIDREAERETVIPGAVELEPDSPLGAPIATIQEPAQPIQSGGRMPGDIAYHCGKMLTFITGEYRPIEKDFKAIGGKFDKDKKSWSIPGSLTEDFLALCKSKGLTAVEVDETGQPVAAVSPTLWPQEEQPH